MGFTLSVRNYRGLRRVEWSPSGVCALVGPNGSGKTTLIDVLQLLKESTTYGFSKALEDHGGAYGLRHFEAPRGEPVSFMLRVESACWEFQPGVSLGAGGAHLPFWEKLSDGEHTLFERGGPADAEREHPRASPLRDGVLGFSAAMPEPQEYSEPVWHLLEAILHYRHYHHYDLARLRREGSRLAGDTFLVEDGRNVFSVLMNWHNQRSDRHRWNFVTDTLRTCFPNLFADFSFPIAANIVSCEVHMPRNDRDPLTPALLPDGFLVALLHLCAVASSDPKQVVAIDEPENALHPYTTRRLMDAFREWSDEHSVTVLLATHSPVILDTFKELPEKVFVMEPGREVLPIPLDQLKKRSWLAHFSLGDLYEHLEYGAPAKAEPE